MDISEKEYNKLTKYVKDLISSQVVSFILGSNPYLYKEIDKVYYKDEYKYFSLYREHEQFKFMYDKFPITIQEYSIKMLSIFYAAAKYEEDNEAIMNIIKNGYKPLIRYLQNKNYHYISLHDIYDRYLKRNNIKSCSQEGFDTNAVYEMILTLFILLMFSDKFNLENVDVDLADNSEYIKSMYTFIDNTLLKHIDIEASIKNRPLIELNEDINYCLAKSNTDHLINDYFNMIMTNEEVKYAKEHHIYDYTESHYKYSKTRIGVIQTGFFSKYIGYVCGILRIVGIEPNIITEQYNINNKEIISLLTYLDARNEHHQRESTDEEKAMYLILYLYMKCLAGEIFKLKDLYFNSAKVESFEQYKKLHDKYTQEKAEKDALINDLKTNNANLENQNKALLKELEQLKNENRRLTLELEESKVNKVELDKLREYAYKSEDLDSVDTNEETIDLEFINSKKILVIGGRSNWHNKLKEVLNNCSFISVDNLNFDVGILSNYDHIFIYTDYLSHALYYKVIDYIRNNNLNVSYLKSSINIKLTLIQLQDLLFKI